GDDVRDLSLLASARLAVAVRPTDALRGRAGEVPELVELERAQAG
ncbi:MAG: haloacid dehalogenase-like hydrolase, partial [Deltaproteobacteria bacterium]|nr:haloacid dehalogenase-like hydrolase [Deltaproteobacteria bacterium]